ncbi:MAG: hypothetical protein ACTSQ8_07945 [Candidatus Helarchaeota archaeon]
MTGDEWFKMGNGYTLIMHRLEGFEKVLGRKFTCWNCKHEHIDLDKCQYCFNNENLQLNDRTLVEIKEKMGDADDRGKDIHPRHRLRDLEQRTVIGLQIIKLELIL